jgi:hypothetical protein
MMSETHGEHDTHLTTHPHGHAAALPFNDEQWQEFHKSDIGAGGAIVVLMTAIFGIGLVMYAVIAFVVAS